MDTKRLGNTDMDITVVGFGAWAIGGGGWTYGWGPQDDEDSIKTIHAALDKGMNWIDTAAVYGLGHSEEIVARAVKGMSEKPYIFTKCSLVWDEHGNITNNQKQFRREVEDSLRRLETDVIDLYQVHWPFPDKDIEEGWSTMADIQKEGKVRWIGVSNYDVGQMKRAMEIAPISSLQPPYSLVKPDVEDEILPFCGENNIGVIVYSPMGSGLLTGKMTKERVSNMPDDDWRKGNPDFQEPNINRHLQMAELLGEIGQKNSEGAPAVSVAWTLKNPAVTAAIVGARRPDQIDGFINASAGLIDDADMGRINQFRQQHA